MAVSCTPQIGIHGNTDEGVKADSKGVGLGACRCVKGWGESQRIGYSVIMTSF